jgi:anti-anti-sigma factor
MINAKLEKRVYYNLQSVYWLKLNDPVEPETFQLPEAIESKAILKKVMKAHPPKLVMDLGAMKDFDSCGMQILLMLYKQFTDQNMSIVLQNPAPYLSRMLHIMQLDRWFEVTSDAK